MRRRGPALARFIQKLVNPTSKDGDCIRWYGASSSLGYGQISNGKRLVLAHRFIWEAVHGPIQDGLFVLHRCDHPWCVNVFHLELGTQMKNIRDALARGRLVLPPGRPSLRVCRRGHRRTEANTYHYRGYKMCKVCMKKNRRSGYHKRARETGILPREEWVRRVRHGSHGHFLPVSK